MSGMPQALSFEVSLRADSCRRKLLPLFESVSGLSFSLVFPIKGIALGRLESYTVLVFLLLLHFLPKMLSSVHKAQSVLLLLAAGFAFPPLASRLLCVCVLRRGVSPGRQHVDLIVLGSPLFLPQACFLIRKLGLVYQIRLNYFHVIVLADFDSAVLQLWTEAGFLGHFEV